MDGQTYKELLYNNIIDSCILVVVLYMERKGVFTSFFLCLHMGFACMRAFVLICLLFLDKVKDLIVFLPNQTCHCDIGATET